MIRHQKKIIFFMMICFAFLTIIAPGTVFGQEEGGDSGPPQQSLWDIIKAGGLIGFVIIGLSIAGIALTIEHFLTIRRDQLVPPDLVTHIEALFEDEEYEEVMNLCEAQPTFFTNVISATLPRIGTSFQQLENTMAEATDNEAMKLFQKIGYISLISNLAPMLGLLGTVTGMIKAFQVIATSKGTPSPSKLADSIGMALVTTALGLFIAIPMTAAFFFFRNRIIRISTEVLALCEELMERFRMLE